MNRKQRRAAAHQERKAARKAGFPTQQSQEPQEQPMLPTNPPISDIQLAANRANAQLSTGPVTPAGVYVSSQNRTVHGLARHNGAFKLLATEDPNGFEALKDSLTAEHQPTTETESILVNSMAESHWLANRAQSLQATCFDEQTGQLTNEKLFSLYVRYQTTHSRAFHKSLNDLVKLRNEKRKAANGFEAQNRKQHELRIKNERHEMKKANFQWEIRLKEAQTLAKLIQNCGATIDAVSKDPGFEAKFDAELAKHGINQPDSPIGGAAAAA